MKILLTGSNGMLGYDLINSLKGENHLILTNSNSLDITKKEDVLEFIKNKKPDIVINSAAYTDVDGCETNQDIAYKVNALGPKYLSLACKKIKCPLVHISTDYVFNGENDRPWLESDEVGPVSVYGNTKLEGENFIRQTLDKFFIIRTAWLYGVNGKNFPKTMIEISKNNDEVSVVNDQFGSPTFTKDLAEAISKLIKTNFYGIYHITNSGSCSWYEFTKYFYKIKGITTKVKPVSTDEFPRPAPRPKYSVLNNKNWIRKGFKPLRDYKEAIEEYVNMI